MEIEVEKVEKNIALEVLEDTERAKEKEEVDVEEIRGKTRDGESGEDSK